MDAFDVVLVGAGHNALVAAAYLAKAGRSVLVLDSNDRVGGFVRTDEFAPGFLGDTYSAAHTLLVAGQVWAELGEDLAAQGLRYLTTDFPSGVSMQDGTTAVMARTSEELVAEADRLAPGDGAALSQMLEEIAPSVPDVFALFDLDLTSPQAREILDRLLRQGSGYTPFAASVMETARDAVARFSSPAMRSMLGSWPTHFSKAPDEAGGGLWAKLFLLASMQSGLPVPQGGSGRLAEALTAVVEAAGGTVRTGTTVTEISVEHGRATAVATADGQRYGAGEAVIASVNPDQLYLKLLPDEAVPAALVRQARGYRYGRSQMQINLALSQPPPWPDQRFASVGQPFLTDSLDGLALHVAQTLAGALPATPTLSVHEPTAIDPTRAPAGQACMRVQVTDVPVRASSDAGGSIDVGDGTWTADLADRFADRVLDVVEAHVPGIASTVVARSIATPDDLARYNANAGQGDPYGGAQDLAQSFFFRPLPGQPSHRTHIPNLFTLGAGTWPGGGISGASGRIVARQLLTP